MADNPITVTLPSAGQIDQLNEGIQQIAGKIGVAATIQIVQTNTLPAGEPASFTETPGSTESARQYIAGVPEGPAGAAAGFGTITTTATQLPSGSQPTFTAGWSGPNEAKNLTMSIGVPAGPPGPTYELTEQDKQSIVQDVLAALPNAEGVGF